MKSRVFLWISLAVVGLAFFYQLARVPAMQSNIWMSPDETANAVSAASFSEKQTFKLPWTLADQFPWAYPRSFVPLAGQAVIVPVGFLGLPLILTLVGKLFGLFGFLLFTPILVMATLWALYDSLPKKWSKTIRLLCLAIWVSFPTVILYANRGAFAQLVIVCLAIWIWWLLKPLRFSPSTSLRTGFNKGDFNYLSFILAGFLAGLVAIIRPVELIWVLPVAVCAYIAHRPSSIVHRPSCELRKSFCFIIPFLMVCLVGAFVGYKTYGQWFMSGYQIRTPAIQVAGSAIQDASQNVSILKALPFEFHPRNILWNMKNYYGIFLWPWTLILIFALGLYIYDSMKRKAPLRQSASGGIKGDRGGFVALAWTAIFVLFFYGNGLYQDYFVPNRVSLGNSFLRYTLPLSVVLSIAAGYVMAKLWKHWSLKMLSICMAVALIAFGQWSAIVRDDEGIAAVETELARYSQIRKQIGKNPGMMDAEIAGRLVIISERSDKIFFPVFDAVSPMPDKPSIKHMVDAGKDVSLFIRTQDQKGLKEWEDAGLPLHYQFTSGNESLYIINTQ